MKVVSFMSFCPKCGNETKENINFCPKCGKKLTKEPIENNAQFCSVAEKTVEIIVNKEKKPYEITTMVLAIFSLFLSVIPFNEVVIYGSSIISLGAFVLAVYSIHKDKKYFNWISFVCAILSFMVNSGWLYYYLSIK